MGFFNKKAQGQGPSQEWINQAGEQAMAQQRAMGIDTAAFGGPSNAEVADDDPIWEPIDGISIQHYAWIAKLASNQGVTDEAGLARVAQENGIDGEQYLRGSKGWVERMGQSMVVGRKFREYYDQY